MARGEARGDGERVQGQRREQTCAHLCHIMPPLLPAVEIRACVDAFPIELDRPASLTGQRCLNGAAYALPEYTPLPSPDSSLSMW